MNFYGDQWCLNTNLCATIGNCDAHHPLMSVICLLQI
jgi:hypothetical protein